MSEKLRQQSQLLLKSETVRVLLLWRIVNPWQNFTLEADKLSHTQKKALCSASYFTPSTTKNMYNDFTNSGLNVVN